MLNSTANHGLNMPTIENITVALWLTAALAWIAYLRMPTRQRASADDAEQCEGK